MLKKIGISSDNILAIVIGIKDYTDYKNLPKLEAADNNANDFTNLLKNRVYKPVPATDGDVNIRNGVPDDHIFKRTDGAVNSGDLRLEIRKFVSDSLVRFKIDLIIFYYSGHGLIDTEENKYYLSVKNTQEDDKKGTALEMSDISNYLTETKKKVVFIIDSCFSENAFTSVSPKADFYIMASSRYNQTTKYPANNYYSLFTSAFIETVKKGIPGVNEDITFNEIFEEIKKRLEAQMISTPKLLFTPQKIDKNETGDIIFEKNNFKEIVKEIVSPFDLDAEINAIFNSFFPGVAIDASSATKVLNSYPLNLAVYIRNIYSDKTLLNSADFLKEFYHQIIHFLSFIFIKDLMNKSVLSAEDKEFFKSWKKTETSDSDISNFYIGVINKACSTYKDNLFIIELNKFSNLLNIINRLESYLTLDRILPENNLINFRKYLFKLLAELKFLKQYDLFAVKFIEVKKSYSDEKIVYEHEVSSLLGPYPSPYSTSGNFESENDFLYNAIIFMPKIEARNELTNYISEHKFLNLWPFMIDGNCNDKDAQTPRLCVFEDITEEEGKQYNYSQVQYKKEREEKRDYSTFRVYPAKEEWNKFYNS